MEATFSPFSLSYDLTKQWALSGSAGLYYQLPPYTALGFKDNDGIYINKNLKYMQVLETSLGLDWHLEDRLMISAEGFLKQYGRMPFPYGIISHWHVKEMIMVL